MKPLTRCRSGKACQLVAWNNALYASMQIKLSDLCAGSVSLRYAIATLLLK